MQRSIVSLCWQSIGKEIREFSAKKRYSRDKMPELMTVDRSMISKVEN